MTGTDEKRLKDSYPTTWERFKRSIKPALNVGDGEGKTEAVNVWWISGSGSFCDNVGLPDSDRRVTWIADGARSTETLIHHDVEMGQSGVPPECRRSHECKEFVWGNGHGSTHLRT